MELLEEANKRFPLGTKYYYMRSSGKTLEHMAHNICTVSRELTQFKDGTIEGGSGYIYSSISKKWATKLYPDIIICETVNQYEIY